MPCSHCREINFVYVWELELNYSSVKIVNCRIDVGTALHKASFAPVSAEAVDAQSLLCVAVTVAALWIWLKWQKSFLAAMWMNSGFKILLSTHRFFLHLYVWLKWNVNLPHVNCRESPTTGTGRFALQHGLYWLTMLCKLISHLSNRPLCEY